MRIANYDALSAAVMGVATITSDPIDISSSFGYAVQCIWTGTPTGTLTLEASCQENAPTAFETISGTSVSLVGAAGAQLYNVSDCQYKWARIKYVGASGAGLITAHVNKKGF